MKSVGPDFAHFLPDASCNVLDRGSGDHGAGLSTFAAVRQLLALLTFLKAAAAMTYAATSFSISVHVLSRFKRFWRGAVKISSLVLAV